MNDQRGMKTNIMLYSAFGLVLDSEIDLAGELPTITGYKPDIAIRLGSVPDHLEETTAAGTFFQLNAREFRFAVDDLAAYYVRDGKEIIVQPVENADPAGVRLFLLGSTLGAALHQRGVLPLHASSIETDKGAVLFCGSSGVGKSTMAAALSKRGYKLLTDDVSVVMVNAENVPVVMPGTIRQKLWANSLEQLEIPGDDLERIRPQLQKYSLPIQENYRSEPIPIWKIYLLATANNTDNFIFQPVEGLGKMRAIGMQTYRRNFLIKMGGEEHHNMLVMQISQQARIINATRPDDLKRLEDFVSQMEEDMLK